MGWLVLGYLACLVLVVGRVPIPAPSPERGPLSTAAVATSTPGSPSPGQDPTATAQPSSPPQTLSPVGTIAARTSPANDTRNAFAFAPLSEPDSITVEGSVPEYSAWSTSKVLVVAAFLDTVLAGDPANASGELDLIRSALAESDAEAVAALLDEIPGDATEAMTGVLRDIGDISTEVPEVDVSVMQWSLNEQIRFMAALAAGAVVSEAASAFILEAMQPIDEQRWGLGTITDGPFKGGWLDADTVTRQMGIVDGYAFHGEPSALDHVPGQPVARPVAGFGTLKRQNRLVKRENGT